MTAEISKNLELSGQLQDSLFATGTGMSRKNPLVSGGVAGSAFVTGDLTFSYRAANDMGLSLLTQFPGSSLEGVKNFLSSKDMVLGYHSFGNASAVNFFIGLSKIFDSASNLSYSNDIGDRKGSMMNSAGILGGVALASAGIGAGTFRTLSVIKTVRESSPSSLLGRLASASFFIYLALIGVYLVVLSVIFGTQMYENCKFKRKLNKTKDLSEQVALLQKKLQVNATRIQEKYESLALIAEAAASGKANLKRIFKELKLPNVSEEKLEEIVYKEKTEEELKQIGLALKIQKNQIKKETKLRRVGVSSETIKELQIDKSLGLRVQQKDPKAMEKASGLLHAIQQANRKKIVEIAAVLGVLVLGMGALIAAPIFTGGMALIASSALMLIFCITMTLLDGYFLRENYRSETPALHDKKVLVISSILAIASLLPSIFLGVGIVPLVIAIAITSIWLGQNGVTWAILQRNQRRNQEKNPSLKTKKEDLESLREKLTPYLLSNLA